MSYRETSTDQYTGEYYNDGVISIIQDIFNRQYDERTAQLENLRQNEILDCKRMLEGIPDYEPSDPAIDCCAICLMPYQDIIEEHKASMRKGLGHHAGPSSEVLRAETGIVQLPVCGHVFCRRDLTEWVESSHGSCPACRQEFFSFTNLDEEMNESSDGGEYIPDDDEEDGFSEDMMPSDMEFTESEPEYDEAWPLWVRRGEFASTRNSNTEVPEDESDRNYQQHIPTNDQEEVGPEVLGRFQAFLERFLAEEESYDDLSMHQSPRNYHPGPNHADEEADPPIPGAFVVEDDRSDGNSTESVDSVEAGLGIKSPRL